MQATNRIRDRIKPQTTQITSISIRLVTLLYQKSVITIYANILFLRFSISIMRIMTSTPQYLDEKQVHQIKEGRCFSCKEKNHTLFDYSRKEKIVVILERFIEDNSS